MIKHTTPNERQRFYERKLAGETYQEIADDEGVCRATVRNWCRRQRKGEGCQSQYRHEVRGNLSQFDPKVRYCILRLRLEHPRWGPNRIKSRLKKRISLKGLRLPGESSIGRYLHQWQRFRRLPKTKVSHERPKQAQYVHQRWQVDFKIDIKLKNGMLVNMCIIRDPVGAACIGAYVFPSGRVGKRGQRVTFEQLRSALRRSFDQWSTMPAEIQTDNEAIFVGKPQDTFPSKFTLWLAGLGIRHITIRPGVPTDNAEVERCIRTVNEYAIIGNEDADIDQLQVLLDAAVHELCFELSSKAKDCKGKPPILAHPELLQPLRPFSSTQELICFDLSKVDELLSSFVWQRMVSKTGQVTLGGWHQYYSVGRNFSHRCVCVRFDPSDRHFVFFDDLSNPDMIITRRPVRDLDIEDLTGFAVWPLGLGVQQLPLQLVFPEGVNC